MVEAADSLVVLVLAGILRVEQREQALGQDRRGWKRNGRPAAYYSRARRETVRKYGSVWFAEAKKLDLEI